MIESAELQNFRGFKQTELKGLSRINIVVGDNGVGKTALLEGLFLAFASHPEVAARFRQWRGADNPGATGTAQEVYDGIFLDLFYKMSKDSVPFVSLNGNANDSRSVRFHYDLGEPTVLPFDAQPRHPAFTGYTPITFEWKDADGQQTTFTPRIQPTGLQIEPHAPIEVDPDRETAGAVF